MPFYEYVKKNIFDVLGMNSTSIHPTQGDNPLVQSNRPLTKGYTLKNGKFTEKDMYYVLPYPAGGAVGTLNDLCKFASAFISSSTTKPTLFQKKETLSTLLSKSYAPCDDYPGIYHGFWEQQFSVRALEHGGNTVNFSSQFVIVRKR